MRRAFRRQDHHNNGQIDRFDFHQVLVELSSSADGVLLGLAVDQQQQQQHQPLSALSDAAFRWVTAGQCLCLHAHVAGAHWCSLHSCAGWGHGRASMPLLAAAVARLRSVSLMSQPGRHHRPRHCQLWPNAGLAVWAPACTRKAPAAAVMTQLQQVASLPAAAAFPSPLLVAAVIHVSVLQAEGLFFC